MWVERGKTFNDFGQNLGYGAQFVQFVNAALDFVACYGLPADLHQGAFLYKHLGPMVDAGLLADMIQADFDAMVQPVGRYLN